MSVSPSAGAALAGRHVEEENNGTAARQICHEFSERG